MSYLDVLSHRYRLSSIVFGRVTATHEGMHLLSRPKVGSRLVMYGVLDGKRIVTSRVARVYTQPGLDGTLVETGNSLYLLQLDRIAAPQHSLPITVSGCAPA